MSRGIIAVAGILLLAAPLSAAVGQNDPYQVQGLAQPVNQGNGQGNALGGQLPGITTTEVPDPAGVSMAIWNGQLLVTAPSGGKPDLRQFGQPLDLNWDDMALTDALRDLQDRTKVNLFAMPDLADARITLHTKAMATREVLSWIATLTKSKMSAVDGAIVYSTKTVHGPPETQLYDIRDLLAQTNQGTNPSTQDVELLNIIRRVVTARTADQ